MKRVTGALAQGGSKTGGSLTQKSVETDHIVMHVVHHVKRVAEEGIIHKGVAPHHRAHHAHVAVHSFEASTLCSTSGSPLSSDIIVLSYRVSGQSGRISGISNPASVVRHPDGWVLYQIRPDGIGGSTPPSVIMGIGKTSV